MGTYEDFVKEVHNYLGFQLLQTEAHQYINILKHKKGTSLFQFHNKFVMMFEATGYNKVYSIHKINTAVQLSIIYKLDHYRTKAKDDVVGYFD